MGYRNVLRRIAVMLVLLCMLGPVRADAAADTLAVERKVYTFLTEDMGLSTAAACGVLANIEHESAFQPTIVGDQGTSYGLCQWHNERYAALRGFCGAMGLDYRTVEGQLAYLKYELGNHYTSLLLTLKALDNTPEGAYRAAYLWCMQFERPSNAEVKAVNRGGLARNKYWNRYSSISVILLPQPEPEAPEAEDIIEYLNQNPVTIPMPPVEAVPSESRIVRHRSARVELVSYTPWHTPGSEPRLSLSPAKGAGLLAAIGAAAVAVVKWPEAEPGEKRKKIRRKTQLPVYRFSGVWYAKR